MAEQSGSEGFSMVALDLNRKFLSGGKADTPAQAAKFVLQVLESDVVGTVSIRRKKPKL